MKLIWQIVRKDLHAQRGAITLLVVLLAVAPACGFVLWSHSLVDAAWFQVLPNWAKLADAVTLLVAWMMIPSLVQADDLYDTRAFWRTRPISWARLLAAKLAAFGCLLVVLPVLVRLPWWLFCGLGPAQILDNVAAIAGIATLLLAAAWSMALLARNSWWYLANTVVMIGWILVAALAADPRKDDPGQVAEWPTRVQVAVLGFVLTGAVVATIAHRFRNRVYALGATGAGLVLIMVILQWLPASWNGILDEGGSLGASVLSRDVTLSYAGAEYFAGRQARVRLSLEKVPAQFAVGISGRHEWTWADGAAFTWSEAGGGIVTVDQRALLGLGPDPAERTRREEFRRMVLQDPWWGDPLTLDAFSQRRSGYGGSYEGPYESGVREGGGFMLEPQAPLVRINQEPPAYRFHARLSLYEGRVPPDQPVRAGVELATGAMRMRVVSADLGPAGLALAIVEHGALASWREVMSAPLGGTMPARFSLWLVNRARDRAVPVRGVTVSTIVAGVAIHYRTALVFSRDLGLPAGVKAWEALSAWRLARIEYVEAARFGRTVETPHFTVSRIPRSILVGGRDEWKLRGMAQATGEVARPSQTYPAFDYQSVLAVLRGAGGVTPLADTAKVTVTRLARDGTRTVIPVNLKAFLQGEIMEDEFPLIQAGDIVNVPRLGGN
jgi:hypothetical protein